VRATSSSRAIRYLSVTLPCDAIFYELLNVSLNKLKTDKRQAVKYIVLFGRFFIFVHKDYKICLHEKYRPLF